MRTTYGFLPSVGAAYGIDPALVSSVLEVGGALASKGIDAAAARRREKAAAKKRKGKKKKAKKTSDTLVPMTTGTQAVEGSGVPTWAYVAGGAVLLGGLGFLIYRMKKPGRRAAGSA